MNNELLKRRLTSYILITSMILSGCGKKSDCEIPSRHVHKYTKQVTDEVTIDMFSDNEHIYLSGYQWNPDYIEITKDDEPIYKLISKRRLFDGEANWEYLFFLMSNCHDYIEYYYEYTTIETHSTTDDEGNVTYYTEEVQHDGWHTDPYDNTNTGRIRLYHHRFFGYRIVEKNGKYQLEKSQSVDDIREIIFEYPYFKEDCIELFCEEFYFNKRDLPNIRPEDFDVFKSPDLTNNTLHTNKIKIK